MTELEEYLAAAGFGPRKAQTDLFTHLISATREGVVAQAGTGTGKSAAVISAAAAKARRGNQSIIVTPTLTLMNQYRDGDLPIARKAFTDLSFAELRGRAHYLCEMTKSGYDVMKTEYLGGCGGIDTGCSLKGWMGCNEFCAGGCDPGDHPLRWECEYQAAKAEAMRSSVVVTNADMLIVNDRILAPLGAEIFTPDGSLFVDEAHTLEAKFRDYASRSLHWKSVERFKFAGTAGPRLSSWIERQEKNLAVKDTRGFPTDALLAIANAEIPAPHPNDGLTKQRETQEACARIVAYMETPHDSAVLHVGQGSLKMDWINVAASSGELLRQREFGLVSATVPKTMAAGLGVPDAPFIDTGHPFDYKRQAWLGFSAYGGDYRSAQHESNLLQRVGEVMDLIRRAKGGALVLFSSFKDLEEVSARLRPEIMTELGLKVLIQEREMEASDRQRLADEFKADGNAVLFGSESYATGFDVPGDALRLVIIWKLPYAAVDPVSNAIRAQSFQRYEDMMRVRAVQAVGRLIRRETDKGIVWFADSRGRRLVDAGDPLTSHIPQFARL